MRLRLSWRAVAVIGAGALVLPALGTMSFASTPSRVSVAGSMPDWARAAHATGSASASTVLAVDVVLPLRNASAAEQLAAAVSNPKSPSYGKYQTAAQFNAKFAPTSASVSKVRSYLSGQGLKVTEVADGNRWISVSGTVKQLDKAFGVTLKNYSYKGSHIAPSGNATLPSDIASLVSGVTGLDNYSLIHTTNTKKPVAAAAGPSANAAIAPSSTPSKILGSAPDCDGSDYWAQHYGSVPKAYGKTSLPTYICGYYPQQIRSAYGTADAVKGGITGKGVTVAIIDAYANPNMKSDANKFSTFVGIPTFKPGQYSEAGTATSFNEKTLCGGVDGWAEEEALDVEAVHGQAPGANINFVGAANCDGGIDKSINYVIQHHSADIVSNSYGDEGEAGLGAEVTKEHSLFLQASIEGIGFYFSSGDDGDDTDDPANPTPVADYPSTDPLITAVGGTAVGIDAKGKKVFESNWGNEVDVIDPATTKPKAPASYELPLPGFFYGGGGGGTSSLFTQPYYQKNVVPSWISKINGKTAMRTTPDVAMNADPFTGDYFLLHLPSDGTFEDGGIGGTSLASPLFAGLQALASQGRPVAIGFANPLMYNLGSLEFNDIVNPKSVRAVTTPTSSATITLGLDSSLVAVKGYDNSTGLGSPNGWLFLAGEEL